MKVQLIVVQGKPEGKVIPLLGPSFKIGRGETCHLRPSSEQVSREHAEFQVSADKVMIRDLGSRNGTLVNGKALTAPCVLKDRDLVQIGQLTFAVSIEKPSAPATTAPAAAPPKAPAKAASPDDVSHADIESWLVADEANQVPERPSGVYGGDTLTITAFKDAGTAAAKPDPSPSPAPRPSAGASPAPSAGPSPSPAPRASASPTPSAGPSASASPTPAAKPAPSAPAARPVSPPPSMPIAPEDMEFERLPEGEGDVEELADDIDDELDDDNESEGPSEDEFIDESNPFYVKKKKESDAPAKPVAKDTSDVASDILRRLMDKRRSSK